MIEPTQVNNNKKSEYIKLSTPEIPKWRQIWNRLTWWRPLTKKEGADFSLMLLKLSEAILNINRVQQKLVANNNALIEQMIEYDKILGKKRPQKIVKGEKGKSKSKPKYDQMFG